VDFDGDGNPDLLSGSYAPGDLYLFRGEGKGRFKASEIIKDKDGKPVRVGYASTVFAYDWRGNRAHSRRILNGPAKRVRPP
jgi:hypothetical protein